jgi:hypothetical protein
MRQQRGTGHPPGLLSELSNSRLQPLVDDFDSGVILRPERSRSHNDLLPTEVLAVRADDLIRTPTYEQGVELRVQFIEIERGLWRDPVEPVTRCRDEPIETARHLVSHPSHRVSRGP